jgi:hypothetical protein
LKQRLLQQLVAQVDVAQSIVVVEPLVLPADAGMDGEPNVDAALDEVVGCGVEHRPFSTWEKRY